MVLQDKVDCLFCHNYIDSLTHYVECVIIIDLVKPFWRKELMLWIQKISQSEATDSKKQQAVNSIEQLEIYKWAFHNGSLCTDLKLISHGLIPLSFSSVNFSGKLDNRKW